MSKKQKSKSDAKRVKVSVPADLAQAVEASGADLEETVERLLRDALGRPSADKVKGKLAGFFQDLAGPHLPQLEAIAKDVASKVAKDVATAAAAAALSTFAAKAVAGESSDDAGRGNRADTLAKPRAETKKSPSRKAADKPPSSPG